MTSRKSNREYGWCVKVIGLGLDVTAIDLSNQFDIKAQRIIIPEHQASSSKRYGLIDGFESEEKALKFICEWNDIFTDADISIRCKLDTNQSESTTNESREKMNSDCPYRHSPAWHACKEGAHCKDYDCIANHPRSRKCQCRYGSECRTTRCSYLHPTTNKPKPSDKKEYAQTPQYDTKLNPTLQNPDYKSKNHCKAEQERLTLPAFAERLQQENFLIVRAGAGSDQSTELPQYAAECFSDDLVVCIQQHPIVAITLARRVAEEYKGQSASNVVGYQIGNNTRQKNEYMAGRNIMFMTDAALIHEFQMDSDLSRIRVLIIDNAHEHSLNTDIVMGIAKLLLAKRRGDFYVVLVISTDTEPMRFLKFFEHPLHRPLSITNHTYSVTVENLPPPSDCPDYKLIELHIIPTLFRLYSKYPGRTLVFLPSQHDVEKALQIFNCDAPEECVALPFYASLPVDEQNKVLQFDEQQSNQHMIVFCTNVLETSFNIKNVRLVIDTGLIRQHSFDINHRWNIFETVRISRYSANQRRDKASHMKNGHCVRLYNDNELTEENVVPEINRASLDLVILQLKRAHLDVQTFPFMNKPNPLSVRHSLDLLTNLMCIDNELKITKRGELVAQLSINPRFSALMINIYTEYKDNRRLLSILATIVAILSIPGSLFLTVDTTCDFQDNIRNRFISESNEYNSDLFNLCTIFNDWKEKCVIDPETHRCISCNKSAQYNCTVCQPCRIRNSLMDGLNYQILGLIESSIELYIDTITNARWKLKTGTKTIDKQSSNGNIIGEHLRKLFPDQIGHLLVPHLPDEGVRLVASDLRASIANRSMYVQRASDQKRQYFVAMFITRSFSGKYVVDRLHQIPAHELPESPIEQLVVRENIGWSVNKEIRTLFNSIRSESWSKWLVYEYDQSSCRLIIWGVKTERSRLESMLQPILTNTRSRAIECGSIRAIFQNGLVCSSMELMETALRLNLQRVPCKNYESLQKWLKTWLDVNRHDIKENNFQEYKSNSKKDDDDGYEAPPFYILFKSKDIFQKASARLPSHHLCSQDMLSLSTTGTHMNEKDAWGRQLVLTIPKDSKFMTAKDILSNLIPHVVDCRQFGKQSIKAHPAIKIVNMPRDANESFVHQILQPIHPLKVSIRPTHHDGTGSSSAHIFFADNQQRQQGIAILQSEFCQKPIKITVRSRTSHKLVEKQIMPIVTELDGTDSNLSTLLITAASRESALQMYTDIIPKMESSWIIDGSATVTVANPHLYPDFDELVQQIAKKFEIQVQQQPINRKQPTNESSIRCYFNHGTPQKTALAANMLAQATSPIIIKLVNHRQIQLFNELFSYGIIQDWSKKLKLEVIKREKYVTSIEIRGPQVQQGQLMRQINDYSDEFDERFRTLELNSTTANFFGRKKLVDYQLQTLDDKWSNWGCHITYISKIKSIAIYAQPDTEKRVVDDCETEIKHMLSEISAGGNAIWDKKKCVFCGKISHSTNTLRGCGHGYCQCASTYLLQKFPLQCNEPKCKMNIDMDDLFEIFHEREQLMSACKNSLQIYLTTNSNLNDKLFCPNPTCVGLLKRDCGYQTCLTCARNVCPSCSLIDDELHQGRTCNERNMVHKMGEFLPDLFKAAEKFARDNWTTQTPPIIRIDYNMSLADQCASLKRFNKGVETLGHPSPPDMARGFFKFHGTAPASIKPICINGFDPSRRAGQACGVGEYFGVTAAVSHGYSCRGNAHGPFSMIIAFLLNCPQLSTSPGFCHVMNNPVDWSYAYNLPVLVVSYGIQATCPSPLDN